MLFKSYEPFFLLTDNRRTNRFIHCLAYMPASHVFLWLFLGCSKDWAGWVYIFVIFMSGSNEDSTAVILVLKHHRRRSLIRKTGRAGNQTCDFGFLVLSLTIFYRILHPETSSAPIFFFLFKRLFNLNSLLLHLL